MVSVYIKVGCSTCWFVVLAGFAVFAVFVVFAWFAVLRRFAVFARSGLADQTPQLGNELWDGS